MKYNITYHVSIRRELDLIHELLTHAVPKRVRPEVHTECRRTPSQRRHFFNGTIVSARCSRIQGIWEDILMLDSKCGGPRWSSRFKHWPICHPAGPPRIRLVPACCRSQRRWVSDRRRPVGTVWSVYPCSPTRDNGCLTGSDTLPPHQCLLNHAWTRGLMIRDTGSLPLRCYPEPTS